MKVYEILFRGFEFSATFFLIIIGCSDFEYFSVDVLKIYALLFTGVVVSLLGAYSCYRVLTR